LDGLELAGGGKRLLNSEVYKRLLFTGKHGFPEKNEVGTGHSPVTTRALHYTPVTTRPSLHERFNCDYGVRSVASEIT